MLSRDSRKIIPRQTIGTGMRDLTFFPAQLWISLTETGHMWIQDVLVNLKPSSERTFPFTTLVRDGIGEGNSHSAV